MSQGGSKMSAGASRNGECGRMSANAARDGETEGGGCTVSANVADAPTGRRGRCVKRFRLSSTPAVDSSEGGGRKCSDKLIGAVARFHGKMTVRGDKSNDQPKDGGG
jgi:hypothetical protein